MTTRPSSSHPASATTSTPLIDSSGRTLRLWKLIGKGGEGSVFAIEGEPTLAAKIYHQAPLSEERVAKFQALIARRSAKLDTISAWPQSLLYYRHNREPCGLLMPRILDARPLHELYGTFNRRTHFPEAQWHHLVLAARNVAAAFDSMHEAGIVVGDVNQGNLLVDKHMCVRFIDCDSFQITADGHTYLCPVGTPHFTPGELQGKNLRDTPRTPEHDRFGMAVLLFHLLFVGRHPFAGRFRGTGDLSIEKAIAEGRFAFARNKTDTLVEPPPFSLLLEDLPECLAELFERAFLNVSGRTGRPAARQWVEQLDQLIRQRRACSFDSSHVYYQRLGSCPWCRIEDEGGPEFFVSDGSLATLTRRLQRFDNHLNQLSAPPFPQIGPGQLKIPQPLEPLPAPGTKISLPDSAAMLMAAGALLCLGGVVSPWACLAGTLGTVAGGAFLMWSTQGKARRETLAELEKRLAYHQADLKRRAETVSAAHQHRQNKYNDFVAQFQAEFDRFHAGDVRLNDALALDKVAERNEFLASRLIQEHAGAIPGMSYPVVSFLQSYGIESALDIDSIKLLGLPITPSLAMELMHWREAMEREFVYKPEHGITLQTLRHGGETAMARFRIYQARRILISARRLESIALSTQEELAKEAEQFYKYATTARDIVAQMRELQSKRHSIERLINRSPAHLAIAAIVPPALGALLWLLFG